MEKNKVYTAVGLMSGTSLDGEIDVALICTDGQGVVEALGFAPFTYDTSVRDKVRACFGKRTPDAHTREAERLVTDLHIAAVKASGFKADIIGFHGQTITHDPATKFTWQLGDGARLAQETGMDVAYDMRQNDIQQGGQGAPLIPLYHQALVADVPKPCAVLNIGGVANVTYIAEDGALVAFDTGTGNAMIDDAMMRDHARPFDEGGAVAASQEIEAGVIEAWLEHPYFKAQPPKSLDRNNFKGQANIATLVEFSVQAIERAQAHFPAPPKAWYVCGGGRKNEYMMRRLNAVLDAPVQKIEDLGIDGDAVEAQGFAYLAVRSLLGYPLTLPSTTGVSAPLSGGKIVKGHL